MQLTDSMSRSLDSVRNNNAALQEKIASLDAEYDRLANELRDQQRLLDDEIKKNEQLWAQYNAS